MCVTARSLTLGKKSRIQCFTSIKVSFHLSPFTLMFSFFQIVTNEINRLTTSEQLYQYILWLTIQLCFMKKVINDKQ